MNQLLLGLFSVLAIGAQLTHAASQCNTEMSSFQTCRVNLHTKTNDAFQTISEQKKDATKRDQYFTRVDSCFKKYGCSMNPDSYAQLADYNTCATKMREFARTYISQCVNTTAHEPTFELPLSRTAQVIREVGSYGLSQAVQFCQIQTGVPRKTMIKCINDKGTLPTTTESSFSWFFGAARKAAAQANQLLAGANLLSGAGNLNFDTANNLYKEFCALQGECRLKVSTKCSDAVCTCISSYNKKQDIELAFRGCLATEAENQGKQPHIDPVKIHNSVITMRRELPQFCDGASDDYSYSSDEQGNSLCKAETMQDVLYGDNEVVGAITDGSAAKLINNFFGGSKTTGNSLPGIFGQLAGGSTTNTGATDLSSFSNFFNFNGKK